MPENKSIVHVSMGKLSKPANTLINKVSDAIGGWFKPYQLKRMAKAEAEAEIIKTESQIQVTDIKQRALYRFMSEESRKQENIESITSKAIPLLSESAIPQDMDDDWITNFFDKCRIISDDEMQIIWANILAGEANSPGSFSKRTVNSLNSIDKYDASCFTKLCSFCWKESDGSIFPIIYDYEDAVYADSDLKYNHIMHLEGIGLILYDNFSDFIISSEVEELHLSYFGKMVNLNLKNLSDNNFCLGNVIMTQI